MRHKIVAFCFLKVLSGINERYRDLKIFPFLDRFIRRWLVIVQADSRGSAAEVAE